MTCQGIGNRHLAVDRRVKLRVILISFYPVLIAGYSLLLTSYSREDHRCAMCSSLSSCILTYSM